MERGNFDLRKRVKYLKACKDALWKHWTRKYFTTLPERHNQSNNGKPRPLKKGDVVIIHPEEKNCGKWPLGVTEELYQGRDGEVRAAKLHAGKAFLERPIQHLYPLEMSCENLPEKAALSTQPNAEGNVFRPRRDAAAVANLCIHDAIEDGQL